MRLKTRRRISIEERAIGNASESSNWCVQALSQPRELGLLTTSDTGIETVPITGVC